MQDRNVFAKHNIVQIAKKFARIFEIWEAVQFSKIAIILHMYWFAKLAKFFLLNMENCKFFAITQQRSLLRHKTAIKKKSVSNLNLP